jgi:hypothetical protein
VPVELVHDLDDATILFFRPLVRDEHEKRDGSLARIQAARARVPR